jgi:HAD superfamily hydrolase (TIGR01490 family)
MIAAVFDLDRTLLPGTTAERVLLRQLVRERVLGVQAAINVVRYLFNTGLNGAVLRIKADRPYFAGMHEATLRLQAYRCVRNGILTRLAEEGIATLCRHKEAGHHTVLLSGSLPYIVEPLGRILGVDRVICSYLEVCQLRLMGRIRGRHPYSEAKSELILEYADYMGLDLSRSYCYADDHTDVQVLQLFGIPVCVNPSRELHRIARERNWRVESFR